MNNNQDNFTKPLNVIPNMNSNNQNNNNDTHKFDNDFINRGNNNNEVDNQTSSVNQLNTPIIPNLKPEEPNEEELNQMLTSKKNKFINNNIDADSPSLTSLNIDTGNTEGPRVDYSKEPLVREKMEAAKKNTVTVTSEGIVFIVIIVVLLVFIFVLPNIFDYIRNITYK